MKLPLVTFDVRSGGSLAPAEIDALYDLRLSVVDLRPQADAAADHDHFVRWCRDTDLVFRFWCRGELVGAWTTIVSRRTVRERSFVAVLPEYAFMKRPFRGHPLLPATTSISLGYALLRHPRLPHFGMAALSPSSFLAFEAFSSVVPLPEATGWERECLLTLARDRPGWDEDQQLIHLPTVQIRDPQRYARRFANVPGFRRYTALNPSWDRSTALPCLIPLSVGEIGRFLVSAAGRLVQGSRRASTRPVQGTVHP